MRKILLIFTFSCLMINCSSKKKLSIEDITSSTLTSEGLGDIKLGNSFSELLELLPKNEQYITGNEGVFWDAIKITLGNNEWLIIESNNGNITWDSPKSKNIDKSNPNYNHYNKSEDFNKIKAIKTNSKRIKTKQGIGIGTTIKSVKEKGEGVDIYSDLSGVNFILTSENIIFKISDKWEKLYYDSGGEFPDDLDERATIKELKVSEE